MTPLGAWRALGATAAAVVVADQVTKAAVRARLEPGEMVDLMLGLSLVNVRNRGIAFGLLADGGALLIVVTLAALVLLGAYFALHAERRGMWLATGFICGGAIGNLADRLREGAVTDFVDLPAWPAFNIADVAITVGVVLLLLFGLATGHRDRDGRGA